MSLKDKVMRAVRANLNDFLDRVSEFEERGGFSRYTDDFARGVSQGFEAIGDGDGGEHTQGGNQKNEKTIREYYANLEVPYGSDLETVRDAYHRLMRKYHPDRHSDDPDREALATELTQELTRAYQAIESYLKTGRY